MEFYKQLFGKSINLQKARRKLRHSAEDDDENDELFIAPDFEAIDDLSVESHLQTMLCESLKLSSRRNLSDYIV